MVIEAVVAPPAGIAAGSLVLVAFGLDSVMELISAGVLIWRLAVELLHGQAFSKDAERIVWLPVKEGREARTGECCDCA